MKHFGCSFLIFRLFSKINRANLKVETQTISHIGYNMISQKVLSKRFIPMLMQTVEAHRKPRWLPVAKSKVFRIPKRPEISEEERLELLRLNNNYKTQMRAIRRFYHDEMIHDKSTRDSASSEMSLRLEAEEWKKCVELNEQWNKQVALDREERRKVEVAAMDEYALQKMGRMDQKHKLRKEWASGEIRREKELSKTFITPDNLDAAIDHALANPSDYNYAIDLKGNQYPGRETPIIQHKESEQKNADI